jgi:hypothetical protein
MARTKNTSLPESAKARLRQLDPLEADFVVAYASTPGPSGAIKAAAKITDESLSRAELRQIAADMLSRPHVVKAVDQLSSCFAGNPGEVLAAITDQAFPDMEAIQSCFIIHDGGYKTWDWQRAFECGAAAFVKKVTPTKQGDSVEFYDRIRALETLGKYHGLWDTQPDVQVNNFDLSKLSEAQLRAIASGKPVSSQTEAIEQKALDVSYRTTWEPDSEVQVIEVAAYPEHHEDHVELEHKDI